ncbi:hypothetical protein FGG08_004209 [Glutinoglossum americanum]|uniref:Sister chromatid cohesion protein Dcc1 n=1 Tax=Glutinoglossum americanum TaxID=1670608 RepID=A0A9P8HWT5_9PEZI|nr:hypothetical protein FGG08_004209 [Glutinoglossum americanum]
MKSLTIKSAPTTSSVSAPSHAVLCTTGETFQLRQVHSSNSIFLIQPSQPNDTAEEAFRSPGLCTIAAPKVTLELHRVATSSVPHLRKLIPTFHVQEDGDGDFEMMTSWPTGFEKRSKQETFAHVPTCEEECERGWIEIVAFELNGGSMRPSIWALLSTYKAILSAATSQGIQLDSRFPVEDLWQMIEDDGFPRALVEAVLARLAPEEHITRGEWASIDKSKCIPWLGALILETEQGSNRERFASDFLKEWKDNLPEAWRASASLDFIKGSYTLKNSTICFYRDGVNTTSTTSSTSTGISKVTSGSRKWHEKFRNTGK